MHRRHRRSRHAEESYCRLWLSPAATRRLQEIRRRKLGKVCRRTEIKLERRLRLLQTRRKRHRPEIGEADVRLADRVRRSLLRGWKYWNKIKVSGLNSF